MITHLTKPQNGIQVAVLLFYLPVEVDDSFHNVASMDVPEVYEVFFHSAVSLN